MNKNILSYWVAVLAFILLLTGNSPIKAAQTAPYLVAEEKAAGNAENSFFVNGDRWTYNLETVPADSIPADAPERTVSYSNDLEVAFEGLSGEASYEVELTFLSDSGDRVMRINAGSQLLEQRLALPFAEIIHKRYAIPSDAMQKGVLTIHVLRVAGPNAVVSAVRLYASTVADGKVHPAELVLPNVSIPRYTPRPAAVAGVKAMRVDLNGKWHFNPSPPAYFWRTQIWRAWKTIEVPGQWSMQGFTVSANESAGYVREFTVSDTWLGHRIKLRCDAVYSEAAVRINGREAGKHLGGFTPFEIDVTDYVKPGQANIIAISVAAGSLADKLASGMQYATHDLGGITRKIGLFVVPAVNVADIHVVTTFDMLYRNATMQVKLQIANDGAKASNPHRAVLTLSSPKNIPVSNQQVPLNIPSIAPGKTATIAADISVTAPYKWDPEHPNLYTLICSLSSGDKIIEQVPIKVGFRQVEVRGNRVYVNGNPVKLRGVCRHETDPVRGRSLAEGTWRKDVQLFRDANVNMIRTSHYPPAEEFIQACDELGMFVEEEAPFCWAGDNAGPEAVNYIVQAEYEMMVRDRNHPSVLQWSLGNETGWGGGFRVARKLIPQIDNTRPYAFDGGSGADKETQISTPHYPGYGGPLSYDKSTKPVYIGEYSHLNCYNRRELATDPGLRDNWGVGFAHMWELMYHSEGTEGGSIWAGIDDTFFMPNGEVRGYGPWGPLDGWRRPKPEYWHVKKTYSPVRITPDRLSTPEPGKPFILAVENRMDFSDLSELRFDWELDGRKGTTHASGAPRTIGKLNIPIDGQLKPGAKLVVEVYSPCGFMMDTCSIPVGAPAVDPAVSKKRTPLKLDQTGNSIIIQGDTFSWLVDAATGVIKSAFINGKTVISGGPHLMSEPHRGADATQLTGDVSKFIAVNTLCSNWKCESVKAEKPGEDVRITVNGEYQDAKFDYEMVFSSEGRLTVSYRFTAKQNMDPWQIGMVFTAPRSADILTWNRKAQWSVYPADHIGRPEGIARASNSTVIGDEFGPRKKPTVSWSQDQTPQGSNDFRSIKRNIYSASLIANSGEGIRILSDGTQHARAWLDGNNVRLFAMDYANDGSESFFVERAVPEKPIKAGDVFAGKIRLELFGKS